ncbi:P-II family nitrogen regulator [Candidatus Macondimonas diazotrophica]|jgi:nitrogen regulatory protein PII|uniref:Transcriptional regulator n=1 Tax=Candidatus Macondimonas diazotrophica TaxID=2305248 RepID=A0A4Z0F9M8_9GAMM|nr:transcriptional regulator [Candidatus Macondimonas diazotrophica]NCU01547.1 transcriptional regulator [Candidatus Macondimonas diazotrophica]TFZ82081.1 transcriptional regulator [Candidatus Macondimonas diazotrophica]HBG29218.1 transcriptional regulator [Gammaproteobacteria bacterium]
MSAPMRKLLTIITEAALERLLVEDIERLGAHGYTVSDARGKGRRGVRSADWEESRNIRIEVVCEETVAEAIAAYLEAHYYADYAMILFMSDVAVLRPEKF